MGKTDVMQPWEPYELLILDEIQEGGYVEMLKLLRFISKMDQVESKIKKIIFQYNQDNSNE